MFNLRFPDYELNKALTILANDPGDPCAMCGKSSAAQRYLCAKCRWHLDRAKYHAVYHFVLRAAHLSGEFKHSRTKPGLNWHTRCPKCRKFYGVNDPAEFIGDVESISFQVAS